MERRLPSFNDFSPSILKGDIRPCLKAVVDANGNDSKVIKAWDVAYFGGKGNKRSSTNIPATLRSTGLSTGSRPIKLSEVGEQILEAPSAHEATMRFCAHVLREKNGRLLLEAIGSIRKRHEQVSKKSLKQELEGMGVVGLSTNTTDHTTLKNWFVAAKIVSEQGDPDEDAIKAMLGISSAELDEFKSLTLGQQVFLRQLRRAHVTGQEPFLARDLLAECLDEYADLFDESQFASKVRDPLVTSGWIEVQGLAKGPQGGKSGRISGTQKLTDIPISEISPDFEQAVPADLRSKVNTPLAKIADDLFSDDKHKGGIALELLALRMIWELGLHPRSFRLRSAETAYAEVDLIAEGANLLFSRWTFQCKRLTKGTKVHLSDVAKEFGIAVYSRAHVVVLVTTTSFSSDAIKFANEVMRTTALQFVFVDGTTVERYLKQGKNVLLEFFRGNAKAVLQKKHEQPLPQGQ